MLKRKNDKRNKLLKTVTGTVEKLRDRVIKGSFPLPKEQAETHVVIDKKVKSEDFINWKHEFNRYGTMMYFVHNFLGKFSSTEEMYNMLIEFNNTISELKNDY